MKQTTSDGYMVGRPQKMVRSHFNELTKASMNQEPRKYNGHTIAHVGWHNEPWKLLKEGTTFDQAAERTHEPIAAFRTRDELWSHIKNKV